MSTDHGSPQPPRRQFDPWPLPRLLRAQAFPTRLDYPLALGGGKFADPGSEALAVDVELEGELPARAELPVLYVGDLVLTQSVPIRPGVLRFLTVEQSAGQLDRGMPVELNWRRHPRRDRSDGVELELG